MLALSNPTVISDLETPQRVSISTDFLYGAVTLGNVGQGKDQRSRDTLWTATHTDGGVTLTDASGNAQQIYRHDAILEIGVAFDSYMLPTITFIDYDGIGWLYYYDDQHQGYTTINLSKLTDTGTLVSPRLCFDDRRVMARNDASVILVYYDGYSLMYRSSTDQYQTSHRLRVETDNQQHYIEQVGMGSNGRLQIVTYTKDFTT